MEYISLNNGVKMPILGYGVYCRTGQEDKLLLLASGSEYGGMVREDG